tara:strand:- start:27690 stop:28514 length:825 start_codon:yes stop_codon:yes gene_type:complete
MIKKAVIPVAGYGIRFLPITKAVPKEMLPIIDRPVIDFIVEEAIESGIEEIIFVTSKKKKAIKKYFGKAKKLKKYLIKKQKNNELIQLEKTYKKAKITYVLQNEMKGLGHAVLLTQNITKGEPFVLMLGDDMYNNNGSNVTAQLINSYKNVKKTVLGTIEIDIKDSNKYGICEPESKINNLIKLRSVIEKPDQINAPSNIAISGRYILTPKIYKYLKTQKPGKDGEIQLTDAINRLISEEDVFAKIIKNKRYDIGTKADYVEAILDSFKLRKLM